MLATSPLVSWLQGGVDTCELTEAVLFPRHLTLQRRYEVISHIQTFRDYFHYHIKASKAYIHSRMRRRTADFLQGKGFAVNFEKGDVNAIKFCAEPDRRRRRRRERLPVDALSRSTSNVATRKHVCRRIAWEAVTCQGAAVVCCFRETRQVHGGRGTNTSGRTTVGLDTVGQSPTRKAVFGYLATCREFLTFQPPCLSYVTLEQPRSPHRLRPPTWS